MSSAIPEPLNELVEALRQLPGVGPRSAERYAYFLLKADQAKAGRLQEALDSLHSKIKYCPKTFSLISAEDAVSPLYSDPRRDKSIVAVVADPFDIVALEKTGSFNGTYHVLGGLISPIDGIGPDELHVTQLLTRVDDDKVKEVILATNASVEGETTALFLAQKLSPKKVKISRLARGLPVGVDLEYADQITLARALEGRQIL